MTDLRGGSIGRYHLIEPLGQGGMAVVYRAYDTRLEREVAVKLIRMDAFPAEVHERVLARFEREAKSLAKLSHAGIVKVHDYGDYTGAPYLVMELLEGGTLKDRLDGPLPVAEAGSLLVPVAEALAYAHRRGILHRDVKPSNILITEEGQVVLTDFGIAKLLEGEGEHTLTGTGVGVGTPEYMAPEQGLGRDVDARADVYALGVVLFELLTGQKPYVADTPMAVILKQVHDPLPRPRDLVPDLPEAVEQVLFKALAKLPEDRYEDMGAFAAVLEKLVALHNLALGNRAVPDGPPAASSPEASGWIASNSEEVVPEKPGSVAQEDKRCVEAAMRSRVGSVRIAQGGKVPVPLEQEARDELERVQRDSEGIRSGKGGKPSTGSVSPLTKVGIGVGLLAVASAFLVLVITGIRVSNNRVQQGNAAMQSEMMETPSFTATPALAIGSTRVRESDGMVEVYVPEGTFLMGSTAEDPVANSDELPQHEVTLDGYWIDRTEVTNGMYAACAQAGGCIGNRISELENPVVSVTWFQAQAYCEWAGGRLPTEAQWEKAARGEDGRLYPWGNQSPDCSLANYSGCESGTVPVGSFLAGASPYGVLDMAGNVWEWVADWYDDDYYERSPDANPAGPTSGSVRVLRGGSWLINPTVLRAAVRISYFPADSRNSYGFRCVRSP